MDYHVKNIYYPKRLTLTICRNDVFRGIIQAGKTCASSSVDRAPVFGTGCRAFKSRLAHHGSKN